MVNRTRQFLGFGFKVLSDSLMIIKHLALSITRYCSGSIYGHTELDNIRG